MAVRSSGKSFLPVSCLLIAASAMADTGTETSERFTLTNRTDVMHFSITGAGKASSFYDPGNHILHETEFQRHTLLSNQFYSQLNGMVRYTDTPQFDPDYWSLQSFEWKLNDAKTQLNFGDYFANLSQYSFNKGIKGVAVQRQFGNDQNYVRAGYGSFDGQWAYLLRNSRADEPMDRYGGGLRGQIAGESWRLGLNLAHARDRETDPRRGVGELAFRQFIPALDWEFRQPSFVITGEHAYSKTHADAVTRETDRGVAHKITSRASFWIVELDGNLEYINAGFLTLGGGASPDRARGYLRGDMRLDRNWSLFGVHDRYFNNLNERLITRTVNNSHELGLKRQRAFSRENMVISASYRRRTTEADNRSVDYDSDRMKIRVSDRAWNVLDWKVEWENTLDDNKTINPGKTPGNTWSASLSSRHEIFGWTLSPSLDVGRQESQTRSDGGFDIVDTARGALVASNDRGTQMGMSFDYNGVDLRAFMSDTRSDRGNIYIQMTPAWMRGGSVKMDISSNRYRYQDSTGDYAERLAALQFQWALDLLKK